MNELLANMDLLAILVLVAGLLAALLWDRSQVVQALRDSVPPEYAEATQRQLILLLQEASKRTATTVDDDVVSDLAERWGIDLDADTVTTTLGLGSDVGDLELGALDDATNTPS